MLVFQKGTFVVRIPPWSFCLKGGWKLPKRRITIRHRGNGGIHSMVVSKKILESSKKIIPFEFGNQAFKTEDLQMKLRHVWRIFAGVGVETSKCPQEGLTYPTEAWECTSRTYITRSHWVCLFEWQKILLYS